MRSIIQRLGLNKEYKIYKTIDLIPAEHGPTPHPDDLYQRLTVIGPDFQQTGIWLNDKQLTEPLQHYVNSGGRLCIIQKHVKPLTMDLEYALFDLYIVTTTYHNSRFFDLGVVLVSRLNEAIIYSQFESSSQFIANNSRNLLDRFSSLFNSKLFISQLDILSQCHITQQDAKVLIPYAFNKIGNQYEQSKKAFAIGEISINMFNCVYQDAYEFFMALCEYMTYKYQGKWSLSKQSNVKKWEYLTQGRGRYIRHRMLRRLMHNANYKYENVSLTSRTGSDKSS